MRFPQAFGPYVLLERVHVGGMAEIFRAKTQGMGGFEKILAIKRIHPKYSEDLSFVKMLVDEAKIAVLLNHVNLCQTFDLGQIQDNYFIAMEYIDGKELSLTLRRCAEGGFLLPMDAAVFIAHEICSGLYYAHSKRDSEGNPLNIVHRDISPQNVLISNEGQVKIVDFGIARAAFRARDTGAGVIKGKFSYMSPEQAWGDPVDQRTDIFSTGVLFFEMLTGRRLYNETEDLKLLDMIRKAEIPRPTSIRSEIPSELEAIVLKALSRKRSERYRDAQEMLNDLNRYLFDYHVDYNIAKLAGLLKRIFEIHSISAPGQFQNGTASLQLMSREDYDYFEKASLIVEKDGAGVSLPLGSPDKEALVNNWVKNGDADPFSRDRTLPDDGEVGNAQLIENMINSAFGPRPEASHDDATIVSAPPDWMVEAQEKPSSDSDGVQAPGVESAESFDEAEAAIELTDYDLVEIDEPEWMDLSSEGKAQLQMTTGEESGVSPDHLKTTGKMNGEALRPLAQSPVVAPQGTPPEGRPLFERHYPTGEQLERDHYTDLFKDMKGDNSPGEAAIPQQAPSSKAGRPGLGVGGRAAAGEDEPAYVHVPSIEPPSEEVPISDAPTYVFQEKSERTDEIELPAGPVRPAVRGKPAGRIPRRRMLPQLIVFALLCISLAAIAIYSVFLIRTRQQMPRPVARAAASIRAMARSAGPPPLAKQGRAAAAAGARALPAVALRVKNPGGGKVMIFGPARTPASAESGKVQGLAPPKSTGLDGDKTSKGLSPSLAAVKRVGSGLILLTSEPSGARILLQGKMVGGKKTPNVIRRLEAGIYTVGLLKKGYLLWTKVVPLRTGDEVILNAKLVRGRRKPRPPIVQNAVRKVKTRTRKRIVSKRRTWPRRRVVARIGRAAAATRPALKGKLHIYSEPKGAKIYVDGRLRGVTNDWVNLEKGKKYRLKLKKRGYREAKQTVRFHSAGQKVHMLLMRIRPVDSAGKAKATVEPAVPSVRVKAEVVKPALARTGPGYLSVNAQPWGEVYIDGKKVTDQTPLFKWRMKSGIHKVQIFWPTQHKFSRRRTVSIQPGKVESMFFRY